MIARHFLKLSVVALLLSPASLFAQLVLQPTRSPLPDLAPVDLSLDTDCRIILTIKNNGPAIVPEAGYELPDGSSVQMYKGGAPWGGIALGLLDKVPHLSQPAGGTVIYPWFPGLALTNGDHVISVDVDYTKSIQENNELNNSLTKTLTCRKGPDLEPTDITLVPTGFTVGSPCRIVVTFRNNGPQSIPDAAYSGGTVPVQMYNDGAPWGGHSLLSVDLSRQLQPVGGTKTFNWYSAPGFLVAAGVPHVLQLEIDGANALAESNETNNKLTKTLQCGSAPPTTIAP